MASDMVNSISAGPLPASAARDDDSRSVILRVSGLTVRFGGIVALNDVSFDVGNGEIYGIIGPNGAGKTTLFNCLSRLAPIGADAIEFDGVKLGRLSPSRMVGLGIGRTFQNLALFRSLSVIENIMLGAHSRTRGGVLSNVFRLPVARREEDRVRDEAWELAKLVGLDAVGHVSAGDLPFGFQKRIELARALAAWPKLLLLDEPAAGLIHDEVEALGDLVVDLRARLGLTVLIVEHHMGFIMKLCDRIVVLNFGRNIAEGIPSAVQKNEDVLQAYLGTAQ
ncbi:High-affinity branched-chain amino acid transport ATP-binding protein BraF [Hyphomicrobiales bacterium]|nr:High-affinity branched-chain amino acid transport ATP-binding protein BraF [Hyphomicrobiales bacterium]CAH1695155.1 High-affinity branched-chain amino acid transport ATP-binding protein BraF [Hyphomicrobiales bacterium]